MPEFYAEAVAKYVNTELPHVADLLDPVLWKLLKRQKSEIQKVEDDIKQRVKELKTNKRHLREQILCANNCQLEKWSFMTGIQLNANCPIDCLENELNGQFKYKTSMAALKAFNSYKEIQNLDLNKEILEKIDL